MKVPHKKIFLSIDKTSAKVKVVLSSTLTDPGLNLQFFNRLKVGLTSDGEQDRLGDDGADAVLGVALEVAGVGLRDRLDLVEVLRGVV